MTLDPDRLRLYLIADPALASRPLPEVVADALAAGVTAVQLRAKQLTDRETVSLAQRLAPLCQEHSALFFVNDRADVALISGADGVHLGIHDVAPNDVRRMAGGRLLIGYSPDGIGDRTADTADYVGIGPIFGTASKPDAGAALGIDEFRIRVAAAARPVVGIGGITAANARRVLHAGAAGVAVLSSILAAPDARVATSALAGGIGPPPP